MGPNIYFEYVFGFCTVNTISSGSSVNVIVLWLSMLVGASTLCVHVHSPAKIGLCISYHPASSRYLLTSLQTWPLCSLYLFHFITILLRNKFCWYIVFQMIFMQSLPKTLKVIISCEGAVFHRINIVICN